jgi:hypothetical protein
MAILIIAIALLSINLWYTTLALYNLGISNLFKTIEEVFEGRNRGGTAEDYLIYAGLISASIFVVFAFVIIIAIILAVVAAPEEGVAVGLGAAAEEAGGAEFLPGLGDIVTGSIGTILFVILFVVVFASTASGVLSFLAASEIRKDSKFNKKQSLKNAYNDAIISGVTGIAIVAFSILGLIGWGIYRYYQQKKIAAEKKERAEKIRGVVRRIQTEKVALAREKVQAEAVAEARIRAQQSVR